MRAWNMNAEQNNRMYTVIVILISNNVIINTVKPLPLNDYVVTTL